MLTCYNSKAWWGKRATGQVTYRVTLGQIVLVKATQVIGKVRRSPPRRLSASGLYPLYFVAPTRLRNTWRDEKGVRSLNVLLHNTPLWFVNEKCDFLRDFHKEGNCCVFWGRIVQFFLGVRGEGCSCSEFAKWIINWPLQLNAFHDEVCEEFILSAAATNTSPGVWEAWRTCR